MKKLTKLIAVIILLSLVLLPFEMPVYAESNDGAIEINKENFPDPLFRNFILNGSHMIWDENNNPVEVVYDANKDGWLSPDEAENIKQLLVMETYIRDLKGMENLTELIEVDCQRSSVEKLYLSNCPDLVILNCYRTQLKGVLDLSSNKKLEGASCHNNRELTGIDVSGCENLYSLTCGATGVTSLDFSNNPEFRSLSCEDTPITELNFSNNPELVMVSAYNSELSDINVSKNQKLEILDVSNCKLTSLDLRNNPVLNDLMAYGNDFAWFELGDKTGLDVKLDDSIIDIEVKEGSFNITEMFPGIDPAKVSIVSGASIDGSIVSGYTAGIPVVYNYNCGTYSNGQLILNVTLNITGYKAPAVPDDNENPAVPDDNENTVIPDDNENPAVSDDAPSTDYNNDSSPETGDFFSPVIWLALILLSGSVMVICYIKKGDSNA